MEGRWEGTLQDRLDADAREEQLQQGVLPPDVRDAADPPTWMQPSQPRPAPPERERHGYIERRERTGKRKGEAHTRT
jgi:hypothetical protein